MGLLSLLLSHFSHVQFCATPYTAAPQAPPSLGFSRQEHWSGLPFPSPVHESEKWKWSRSVMSNSSRPHGLQPTRLLRPWDLPGKSTAVGRHCLLQLLNLKPTFSLFFHHHQQALYSSLLSAIRVASSWYLRLLIFLPAILIPAFDSPSLAFCMMYSS